MTETTKRDEREAFTRWWATVTPEMLRMTTGQFAQEVWRAALATAPEQAREPVSEGRVIAAIKKACGEYRTNESYSFEDVWNCIEAFYTVPPPASTNRLTDEQADDDQRNIDGYSKSVARALETCDWSGVSIGVKAIIKQAIALLSQNTATEPEIATSAIHGALLFGYQNANPPPSDDHWLAPFWNIGRERGELESAHSAMAKDAARYRWLRSRDNSLEQTQGDKGIDNGTSCYHRVEGVRELKHSDDLDAAIDTAIIAATEGK